MTRAAHAAATLPATGPRALGGSAPIAPESAGAQRWRTALAIGALTVATWPARTLVPTADLDQSWMGGLHVAARQGLQHGSDIVFTYGPLGFLNAPQVWSRGTVVLALAFTVIVRFAFLAALLVLLHRVVPLPVAIAGAYVATRLVVRPATELLTLAMLLWALHLIQSAEVRRWRLWLGLGAAVTAVELLAKFGDGVYCFAILGITALALGRPRLRATVTCVGGALLLVVGLWLALGQSLADLGPWVAGNLQLAKGYGAMAVEEPGRGKEYVAALLYVAGLVALLVLAWSPPRRGWAGLLLLGAALIEFEHGFIRHNRHSLGFFLFLVALPFALRVSSRARLPQFALSAFALSALAIATQESLTTYLHDAVISPVTAVRQVAALATAQGTAELQDEGRAGMRAQYAVAPAVLAALEGSTVHIDPYDTSAVWAYDLDWNPVPVFQTYAAFTPALDELNATALTDAGAPERILQATHGTIDGRFQPWESPRYSLAMLCHYRPEVATEAWQVLTKTADRCGSPEPVATVQAQPGETLQVPEPSAPDRAVFARLDLPAGSPVDRLLETVFKPLTTPMVELDGQPWRYVAANASGPLLLRVPDYAPDGPGAPGRLDLQTLRLPGLSGPARIEFYEIALAP